ncbi:MAG: dihydropteroate synthase [Bacteroidales bacterium]|nr:dihydropteroate synthase [Bacteroidales bacterium]
MNTDRKIELMGIVNLTDDSYFAQSRCADVDAALRRVEKMVMEGADIVDIGACSSRPGSVPVGADEEWRRLEPVLAALRRSFPDLRVSIDTYWASVVEKAYGLIGDFIVNDISAGEDDSEMLATVGKLGLEYVAMHKRGTSLTMQSLTGYDDVVAEVIRYFREFSLKAQDAGIRRWILDPGFGFAKTVEQNYRLLASLPQIRESISGTASGVLVGVSRKSMIYKPLGITHDEALSPTQAVHMAALIGGADVLRVHDVKEAKQTVLLYEMMQNIS